MNRGTSFLSSRLIPVFISGSLITAGEGSGDEARITDEVPIAVLIEFSTRGDEGCSEESSEFLVAVLAELFQSNGEVDILDGYELRVEPSDCFAGFSGGPEGPEGDMEF